MAEAFLSRVLRPMVSRALKKALGGVFDLEKNTELEVSALKGVVALSDIRLQPDLVLPGVEIVEGVVGRLELKIPWQRLGAEPVHVSLSNVDIVLRLSTSETGVAEVVKRQRLRAAELVARAEDAEDEANEADEEVSQEVGEHGDDERRRRWVDRVLENIAFSGEVIKICILAPSSQAQGVSFTISIDSISLETTDSDGKPAYVTRQDDSTPLHRRGLIRGLSAQVIDSSISATGSVILEPMWISCVAEERSRRRRVVDCHMGPMRFRIAPAHVKALTSMFRQKPGQSNSAPASIDSQLPIGTLPISPRPVRPSKPSLRAWVVYAMSKLKVDREKGRRLGWIKFCERVTDRRRYIDLYKRRLHELDAAGLSKKEITRAKMSPRDAKELDALEIKLPFPVVLLFRGFAEAEMAFIAGLAAQQVASGKASSSTTPGGAEKKKSRFGVLSKITGRLRRKKTSSQGVEFESIHLPINEKQKLYEDVMATLVEGSKVEDRSNTSSSDAEQFGSTYVVIRASSLEITLVKTGPSDAAFARSRMKNLYVDAGFFIDTNPEIDFSVSKLELIDEKTEANIISFGDVDYVSERPRRLSGFGTAGSRQGPTMTTDPSSVQIAKKNVKSLPSFFSKHLVDWKEDLKEVTKEDAKAKVIGRVGQLVKVAPIKVVVTANFIREIMAFFPTSTTPGRPITTQVIFETPKLFFVGEDDFSTPLVSLDAKSVELAGVTNIFSRCGIAFGSRPRCLPVDVSISNGNIEMSLSEKDPRSSAADATRIRLELTSAVLAACKKLLTIMPQATNKPKSPGWTKTVSFSLFSPLEIALVDLETVILTQDLSIESTSKPDVGSVVANEFRLSTGSLEVFSLDGRKRKVLSVCPGLRATWSSKQGESARIEAAHPRPGFDDRVWMLWDSKLMQKLLEHVSVGPDDNGSVKPGSGPMAKFSSPIIVEFIDKSGAAIPREHGIFARVTAEHGVRYESGTLTLNGPIMAESLWMCQEEPADPLQCVFFTCDETISVTLPSKAMARDVAAINLKGRVLYRHFQTLALELNDVFQTQIAPLFVSKQALTNASGPVPYSLVANDGFNLDLFPCALPKDVTHDLDWFELVAKSFNVRSTKKVDGKDSVSAHLSECRVARFERSHGPNIDAKRDPVNEEVIDIKVVWDRADLDVTQSSSIFTQPLVLGCRKDGPFARRRTNKYNVKIAKSKKEAGPLQIFLTRTTVRVFPLLLSMNLPDQRRLIVTPDSQRAKTSAAKWTTMLTGDMVDFPRVDKQLNLGDEFLSRELILEINSSTGVDLCLHMVPSDTVLLISTKKGLLYHSKEIRSIAAPEDIMRPSILQILGEPARIHSPALPSLDMSIHSFNLHRFSRGWNKDELHHIQVGEIRSKSLADACVLVALATFATKVDQERERIYHVGVDPSTNRWSKYFCFEQMTWEIEEEGLGVKLNGAMLQSRRRSELAYSLQCGISQTFFFSSTISFSIDGMLSTEAKHHSVLCEPVHAHASLASVTKALTKAKSLVSLAQQGWKKLKDQPKRRGSTVSEDEMLVAASGEPRREPVLLIVSAFRGFQLTLLTTTGKPCLRLFGSKTIFRSQSRPSDSEKTLSFTFFDEDGVSGVGFGVSCFNQAIVKWEPLLEQAILNIDLRWNAMGKTYGCIMDSTDPVKINVTVAACEAMRKLTERSSLASDYSANPMSVYSEWIFENDSGEDVVLEVDTTMNKASFEQFTVPQGARIPLRGFDGVQEKRTGTIHFASPYLSLKAVPLNLVGYFVYSLYPKVDPHRQRQTRMVQVSLSTFASDGFMIVKLCSSVAVENLTGVPLEILLMPTPQEEAGEELTGRSALLGPLQPDNSLSLPIQSLTTRLSIRPAIPGASYSWWTGMGVFSLKTGSEKGICEAVEGSNFTFTVCVQDLSGLTQNGVVNLANSNMETAITLNRREGRYNVVFLPAMTITNALPVELDFRFAGHTERVQLRQGQTCKSHEVVSKLMFRVATSAWSEPFIVGEKDDVQAIILEDSQGKQLKLLAETKLGMGNVPRVTVFARAWFLNKSGLPLAYRVADSGVRLFDAKAGHTFTSISSKLASKENDFATGEIRLGSTCEFLVGEKWMQVVVLAYHDVDQTFDVVLTDTNVKVGGVKVSQLRRARTLPVNNTGGASPSSSGKALMGGSGGREYLLFSETSGMLQVKVDSASSGSMWSHPFSIDNVGTDGVLALKKEVYPPVTASNVVSTALNVLGQYYVLGVHVGTSSQTDFKMTPVVTLVPRHVIVNKLPADWGLVFASDQDQSNRVSVTEETMALHVLGGRVLLGLERLVDFTNRIEHPSLTRSGFKLSGVVDISRPCQESVKLHNKRSGECLVLKVVADWLDSTSPTLMVTISFSASSSQAFYWVVNETRSTIIHYYQLLRDNNTLKMDRKGVVERIFPGEAREFGWDEVDPFAADRLASRSSMAEARMIEFDFGGGARLLRVRPDDLGTGIFREGQFSVRVFVENITKCMVITEEVEPMSHGDDEAAPSNGPLINLDDDDKTISDEEWLADLDEEEEKVVNKLAKSGSSASVENEQSLGQGPPVVLSDSSPKSPPVNDALATASSTNEELAKLTIRSHKHAHDASTKHHVKRTVDDGPQESPQNHDSTQWHSPASSPLAEVIRLDTVAISSSHQVVDTDVDVDEKVEMVDESTESSLTLNLAIHFSTVVVSFVDSFPQEIAAIHISKFETSFTKRTISLVTNEIQRIKDEEFDMAISAGYVQVDNCSLNSRMPVILWPTLSSTSQQQRGFLLMHASGRISPQLIAITRINASVEPFDLYLEERIVLLGLRMWQECKEALKASTSLTTSSTAGGGVTPQTTLPLASNPITTKSTNTTSFLGRTVFIEALKIDAMSFSVTIQRLVDERPEAVVGFPRWRGPGTVADAEGSAAIRVESLLAKLPSALTDVDRALVLLPVYEARRVFSTLRQSLHEIKRRYSQELLSNVYRILSTELVRVVSPLGGGMRVEDASSGLLHGAYGAFDAASKVSGAIGSTAAYLSFDSKFVSSRRQALIDERPDGIGSGVVMGAKAIGTGIVLGLAGVVTQPISGASESGVVGFVTGVGKGIVGIGVRPVVGVFDMVANVLAGARSATAWLDPSETPRRARLPRMIGGEARALQPFDARSALVQDLLVKLWGVKRWREAVQGDFSLEYRLLEQDALVLVRVDTLLVCVDFGSYADLLGQDQIDLGTFSAARPVLAWEVDGRAIGSFEIDENEIDGETMVRIRLHYFNNSGVVTGYGRAGGIVKWVSGGWVLSLPVFNEESLGYLCRALQRVMFAAQEKFASPSSASSTPKPLAEGEIAVQGGFGLITTAIAQKCVVGGVQPDSLAEKAGFQVGDVILGFFGRPLSNRDAQGASLHAAIGALMDRTPDDKDDKWAMDVSIERQGMTKRLAIVF